MLYFQVNSEGTQPYIYTYPFSPKPRSCVGCHMALTPSLPWNLFTGYILFSIAENTRGGPCAGVLFRLFLMRRDLSSVPLSSVCLFSSGRCLIFSSATVFSTLAMVFLGVCLCLSCLRFVEFLGSTGLCFLPDLGDLGPYFLAWFFYPIISLLLLGS